MGESSRRKQIINEASTAIAKELADQGKLIEMGFTIFALIVIPRQASKEQVDDMKIAFMSGAQHLWGSIINLLSEGQDATEDDFRRLEMIGKEMEGWAALLSERIDLTKGKA